MTTRISGLTGATIDTAPTVCHECIWWQTRNGRSTDKRKWIRDAEDEWGAWGTVYHDDDGRLLGSMQYGPSELFPRARELPAGPPTDDAVLVTCAYLTDPSRPWVMQSLFLTAIGDSRERGARALEAFAYRYPEGETNFERFHVHKTIFPADFLADFGFVPVRSKGRVELARLALRGLQSVEQGKREAGRRVVPAGGGGDGGEGAGAGAGGVHARTRAAALLAHDRLDPGQRHEDERARAEGIAGPVGRIDQAGAGDAAEGDPVRQLPDHAVLAAPEILRVHRVADAIDRDVPVNAEVLRGSGAVHGTHAREAP